MWFSYPCSLCGRLLSFEEDDPDEDYDCVPRMMNFLKQHVSALHSKEKLPLSDKDLIEDIRDKYEISDFEPSQREM